MIPYEWRRDPNAHQYFHKFTRNTEEHQECVICMNKVSWEIDAQGNLINESQQELASIRSTRSSTASTTNSVQASDDSLVESQPDLESGSAQESMKKAKQFMKTPCNHVFHPVCLTKWMEIRMECPYCRQDLPPIDD